MATEQQTTPTTESRLSAIEAILPHLARKEDVAKLEIKIVETKHELMRWMVGTIVAATTILGIILRLTG